VLVYGLVDRSLQEAIELYLRREDAEEARQAVIGDEPWWDEVIEVQEIELHA
jgi:hypothetical protein